MLIRGSTEDKNHNPISHVIILLSSKFQVTECLHHKEHQTVFIN